MAGARRVGEWDPGEDVIEVVRAPAPGATRGAWRTFRETARGLKTTFGRIIEGPTTVQSSAAALTPSQPEKVSPADATPVAMWISKSGLK